MSYRSFDLATLTHWMTLPPPTLYRELRLIAQRGNFRRSIAHRGNLMRYSYARSNAEACITVTLEQWGLNLVKLVINIHIWVKVYTFGHKYTHTGVNILQMCSLEA